MISPAKGWGDLGDLLEKFLDDQSAETGEMIHVCLCGEEVDDTAEGPLHAFCRFDSSAPISEPTLAHGPPTTPCPPPADCEDDDLVPEGYWEALGSLVSRLPTLPEFQELNDDDPEPYI
jgi:hypothetical protein